MSSSDSPVNFFRIRLKELRKSAKLTQEELAEQSGISAKYLQAIELGTRPNVSLMVIGGIAKALGLGLHEILAPDLPKVKVKPKPRPSPHGKSLLGRKPRKSE